jgi:hypothetical protein
MNTLDPDIPRYNHQAGETIIVCFARTGALGKMKPQFHYHYRQPPYYPSHPAIIVAQVRLLSLEDWPPHNYEHKTWWQAQDTETGETLTVSAAWRVDAPNLKTAIQAARAYYQKHYLIQEDQP